MTMPRRNIVAALVLMALSGLYIWQIGLLPDRGVMPNTPGPSFFPILIVTAILLLSAGLLFEGVVGERRSSLAQSPNPLHSGSTQGSPQADTGPNGDRSPDQVREKREIAGAAVTIVAFAVYLALLPWLGFILATIPFFAVLMVLFGSRNPVVIAIGAIAIPLTLFILFRYGFNIVLPRGLLDF